MGRKITELSNEDLAVATIGTERRVGAASAEAQMFRAEITRRASTDKGITATSDRARRLAVIIEEGYGMEFFRANSFSREDRQLALALGARRPGRALRRGAQHLNEEEDGLLKGQFVRAAMECGASQPVRRFDKCKA